MADVITYNLDIWTSALLNKSTTGRGSNDKQEAYGIKKLRELILEFAVRGRLVPQEPGDESASALLERVRAQKEELIAAGKVKWEKTPRAIVDADKPFALPNGWIFVRLGDLLLSIKSGGTPSKHNPAFWNGEIPWASVKDLGFGEPISSTQDRITLEGLQAGSCLAEAGSLLICTRMGLGKIGEALIDMAFNQDLKAVALTSGFIKQYFINFYKTVSITGSGMTVAGIKQDELLNFIIPLPPLAEQHRIVAKIDELMALCDQLEQQQAVSIEAHQTLVKTLLDTLTSAEPPAGLSEAWSRIADHFETLFTNESSIDQLKQTILQLAVMGKLVPQDPNDEPASVLLNKIVEEKGRLIEAKEIQGPKDLPKIKADEMPFRLPKGWQWAYVWDVARIITSGSRDWAKYYSNNGAKFLTMGNLSRGDYRLRLDSIRYVNPPVDGEGSRTRLEANDLLISITGDVGNLGLIPQDFGEAYINQHTCLLRFMPDCQNRYFPELMRSPWAKYQFDAPQRGVKNSFRLSDVGEMLIPIPPLAEQHRIVAKVDGLMALCDTLKVCLNEAQNTQVYLADAIVEQTVG